MLNNSKIGANTLLFSTLLGGSDSDDIAAIEIGNDGKVFAAGLTASTNFSATTGVLLEDTD